MESLKVKTMENSDKAKVVLANLQTKATKKKSEIVTLVRNPEFQHRSLATAGGTIVLGSAGGAFGCASGILLGSAAGVVPALFTFGLSIPAGGAIGGIGGLCSGTLIGGACGGAGGLTIYKYRIQIKSNAMVVKVKMQSNLDKAIDTVKYTITLARKKADERLQILQSSVTDLACIAQKRSLAAANHAKSKSSEAYTFATTTRAGVTASGAVAGAVVGGGATGAVGSVAGAAIGVVPAIFTFGLSIPAGAIIGGCVGTAVGGSAGAVGGGLAGYGGYTHRHAISKGFQSFGNKVQEIKGKGVAKLADAKEKVEEMKSNGLSKLVDAKDKVHEMKSKGVTKLVGAKESLRSAVTGSTGCSEDIAVEAQ